jgi:hypothetical protein
MVLVLRCGRIGDCAMDFVWTTLLLAASLLSHPCARTTVAPLLCAVWVCESKAVPERAYVLPVQGRALAGVDLVSVSVKLIVLTALDRLFHAFGFSLFGSGVPRACEFTVNDRLRMQKG